MMNDNQHKASDWKYLTMFLVLVCIFTSAIVGLRYHQKSINIDLLDNEVWWFDSPIAISGSDTHHVEFFRRFPKDENWESILRKTPSLDTSEKDIKDKLRLFHYYEIYASEKRYLDFLRDNLDKDEYLGVLKWYLDNYLFEDFLHRFQSGQYEWARYRAQMYINYAYSIPPDVYFEYASYQLSKAREVVEFSDGTFPYESKNTADRLSYRKIADQYEYSDEPSQVSSWKTYISDYSRSPRQDEAEFNIINYKLNNMVGLNGRAETLELLDRFITKYKESYLADDALWHAIQLATELGLQEKAVGYFGQLSIKYQDSDHAKRLKHNIKIWLNTKHKLPDNVALMMVEFMFDLPINNNVKLEVPLSKYAYDQKKYDAILGVLRFMVAQYNSANSVHLDLNVNSNIVSNMIFAFLYMWVKEGMEQ